MSKRLASLALRPLLANTSQVVKDFYSPTKHLCKIAVCSSYRPTVLRTDTSYRDKDRPLWNGFTDSQIFCFSTKPPEKECVEKPSLLKRFKDMYRDYWYVLVPVHLVTSLGWFGSFYYLAESGVDLASFAESLHFSEAFAAKFKEGSHSTTGYLAIAYLLYKVATPLRYTVTLGGTTISINYLKKWGYIRPTNELKKIFEVKKEVFKEKKATLQQNFMDKLSNKKR